MRDVTEMDTSRKKTRAGIESVEPPKNAAIMIDDINRYEVVFVGGCYYSTNTRYKKSHHLT